MNEDRLLEFVNDHNLCIMNTFFKHHARRLYTLVSPDALTTNQIDYIIVPQRWKTSVLDVKSRPGADCGSDHQLLQCTLKMKVKTIKRKTPSIRYDVSNISHEYKVKVQNTFAVLAEMADDKDGDELANESRDVLLDVAAESIRRKRGTIKK